MDDLPPDNDSHSNGKIHHAMNGKTHELSMAMFKIAMLYSHYRRVTRKNGDVCDFMIAKLILT